MAQNKTSENNTGTDQDKPEGDAGSDIEQQQDSALEPAKNGKDADTSSEAEIGDDDFDTGDLTDKTEADDALSLTDDKPQAKDDSPTFETPTPQGAKEQVVIRKGGFLPMMVGGVVAATAGFGVSQYMGDDWPFKNDKPSAQITALEQRLEAQNATLSDLQDRLGEAPDLTGLETTQAGLASQLAGLDEEVAQITSRLDSFDERLTEVENRPAGELGSDAAVAAYEQDLKTLQEAVERQRAEIESIAQEARAMEESAQQTAQVTMRRAVVTRIQTALDSGTGFAPALADLEATGATVPDALRRAASAGVPTLAQLNDSFPDAARRALRAVRSSSVSGSGGVGTFLRDQLGMRSLTPKEGNDPDAVLSRAEAAIGEGRLQDALAELEALPEAGRAELSDWSELAKQRLEALSAAEALTQDMN